MTPIFTIPIRSRPGFERVGCDVTQAVEAVERQGVAFEHAYDY